MNQHLLLIDGHNLLFQMFFGMPNKIPGKDGRGIEGIWGFTGALLKIIDKIKPTHVLVIFDGEQKLNREEWSCNYKKNRPNWSNVDAEKNPFSILKDIQTVLTELGISFFETTNGYETDDYVKEYCKEYESTCNITISSFDYDFISLVNDHITLLTYRGSNSTLYDEEKVLTRWKIKPEFFPDYKALVGDSSDNIAGIPRIGPKMAVQLINEFGHAEEILNQKEKISKEAIRSMLNIFEGDLRNNLNLIRLTGTDHLPILLSDLKWVNPSFKTKELLTKLNYI